MYMLIVLSLVAMIYFELILIRSFSHKKKYYITSIWEDILFYIIVGILTITIISIMFLIYVANY